MFSDNHANRQGIAVLGFQTNNVDRIRDSYQAIHPNLIHSFECYETPTGGRTKVFQAFAYYSRTQESRPDEDIDVAKSPEKGTLLRFVEVDSEIRGFCILPGLVEVEAVFDAVSQPAYCDHWVSNVFSRTEFLRTLEDTLGFTPKVDFNAGVVAAGEAQIESTVTGNDSNFETGDKLEALKDQSQVFLPINNALSKVGCVHGLLFYFSCVRNDELTVLSLIPRHVHGFLEEIGQGIQHVASRVDDLVDFVERCNRIREITGEVSWQVGRRRFRIIRKILKMMMIGFFFEGLHILENPSILLWNSYRGLSGCYV